MDNTVLTEIPSQHIHADYIKSAVEDGFVLSEGPWGWSKNDWSVTLTKESPELNGAFIINLIDRAFVIPWKDEKVYDSSVGAWFKYHTTDGSSREHSLDLNTVTGYSYFELLKLAGTCDDCGRNVGIQKLHHVGFANEMCEQCYLPAKQRLELGNWYS